jgi:uncharacterized LabA/DUF88 family protein
MSNISQKQTTYLFVDGSNFRQYFNETTQKWFGQEVEFDFKKIKDFFQAEKVFYYDCIDDIKTVSETPQDFEIRVNLQEEKLNKIREVQGCHVHLGSLSGKGKKKRQKEVDVLLAVQMMEHAFRGNMSKAILLSGDKDFRPLVESLVRLGLFVEVVGDQKHISKDLIHSADTHRTLNFVRYYDWVTIQSQIAKPLEIRTTSFFPDKFQEDGFHCIKEGKFLNNDVKVFIKQGIKDFWLYTPIINRGNDALVINNDDYSVLKVNSNNLLRLESFQKLELYFELIYGEINWNLQ